MFIVNVDFFSSGRVSGWTNAKVISTNSIFIKTKCGLSQDITDLITVIRPDVNAKYHYDIKEKTGFTINLFDLFNDRIQQFDIYIDNYKAWSSSEHLNKIEMHDDNQKKRFFEIGGKRIFIIYENSSWLDTMSGKLNSWNKNQFNKSLNNGIAISFINFDDFKNELKNTDFTKSQNIFIIERTIVKETIIINNKIATYPILVMEKNIDLDLDYNGILSSIFIMNNFSDGTELTPIKLRTIIDTLTTYCELFFDSDPGNLLHVYGDISEETAKEIRLLNNDDFPFKGCIVVSKEKLLRLDSFDNKNNAIFINSSLLKNTFDIINSEPLHFLTQCLKRGIKVKNLLEKPIL